MLHRNCFRCGNPRDAEALINGIMMAVCQKCNTIWPLENNDPTKFNDTKEVKTYFFGHPESD